MANRRSRPLPIVFQIVVCVLMIACPFLQTTLHAQDRVVIETGITYGKGDDVDLKLDLARPPKGDGPFPALVFIFGGGWYDNSREQFDIAVVETANKGYVAVTVDYRLTRVQEKGKPKYLFPAQIHDVKCAVRWLRANAGKYKIDPDRIGAVGWSSGGHLALMLGLTEPSDELEGKCGNMEYSSRVQAVVNFAGPTELISWYHETGSKFFPMNLLGGTPEEVPEQYKRASPLTYVRKDNPPILTIHGDRDYEVPLEQAELLDAKMKEVGASHTLIVKKGRGHESFHNDKAVWDFFDRILKVGG